MTVRIDFNVPEHSEFLNLLDLGAYNENDKYYIEISIVELFALNNRINRITNKYWDVIVGTRMDEPIILIQKTNLK
jgi:hypothetical protein